MDRFDAMRAYVQVVESGSFTKAAQALMLHKATVSQQVRQLEDKLAIRLLTRTTRSVVPTAEGLAYYRRACTILQQVDEAESMLSKGNSSPGGRLRVEVPSALGRLVLVPEIRSFLERYPRITLELGCTDRTIDLLTEGVDCALRGDDLPDSSLVSRRVGKVSLVLCAAPRYIDEHGLPDRPEDLAQHAQIGYLPATKGQIRAVRLSRDDQTVEVEMPSRFVTSDNGALLSAGLDGLGIIQIMEFVASHHLASGALLRVLPTWRCAALPLNLITPTARHRTARVQVFADWVRAVLGRRLGASGDARR
jgi:LysR family transcriptional regulator, regulator for bpeEF and oprC